VEVFLGPWGDDEAKFTEAARKLDAVREGLSRKTPAELGARRSKSSSALSKPGPGTSIATLNDLGSALVAPMNGCRRCSGDDASPVLTGLSISDCSFDLNREVSDPDLDASVKDGQRSP
jgi:hypothetical protein